MDYQQKPIDIPYLFIPLTETEENQLAAMQDFMHKYRKDLPAMSVKAMLHHMAIQLQNIIKIWQTDLIKQVEKHDKHNEGPLTEQQKGHITNMLLAQIVAFVLANKTYVSSSNEILKSATVLLSMLYPPSDKETK